MEHKDIVLVDDHEVIRNGMKELIEKLGPYRVSRQYGNGRELLDSLPMEPAPDLVVMDLSMPEMDGDEALEAMKARGIDLPVLVLTLNQDEARLVKLFRLGVRGYLKKNCTAATMKEALQEIFAKGYYHNEHMLFALRTRDMDAVKKTVQQQILEQLSVREMEFMRLICHEEELTYDQIAGMMGVQHRTVDGYRQAIFERFGIKSKTGLVLFILKHRLLDYMEPGLSSAPKK